MTSLSSPSPPVYRRQWRRIAGERRLPQTSTSRMSYDMYLVLDNFDIKTSSLTSKVHRHSVTVIHFIFYFVDTKISLHFVFSSVIWVSMLAYDHYYGNRLFCFLFNNLICHGSIRIISMQTKAKRGRVQEKKAWLKFVLTCQKPMWWSSEMGEVSDRKSAATAGLNLSAGWYACVGLNLSPVWNSRARLVAERT